MAVDWGQLLGALAAYYGSKGESGSTPNFYNVPMSPEDKAWNDRRMAVYDAGGSPQMKAAGSAAQQFFSGLPTTASPSFASPMMRGQAFAGGITLPKIDLSKFDFGARPVGAGTSPPGRGEGDVLPTSEDRAAWKASGDDDPLNPRGGGGPLGPDPYGLDRIPPTGAPAQSPKEAWNSFTKWWAQYRYDNPNWKMDGAKAALGAAASIYGGPFAQMALKALFLSGKPEDPGVEAENNFYSFWNGTSTGGGSAYGPNQRPPGMGGTTPAPGVGMTGGRNTGFSGFGAPGSVAPKPAPYDPWGGYAGYAGARANANYFRNLQAGGNPFSGGSTNPAVGSRVRNMPNRRVGR